MGARQLAVRCGRRGEERRETVGREVKGERWVGQMKERKRDRRTQRRGVA